MKRRKKKSNRIFIISIGVILLLILVMLAIQGVRRIASPGADTEEGLAYIKAAESDDIATIEQKISQLEGEDSSGGDSRSNKEKFSSSVVMGDSIAAGFAEYDVLNSTSVEAKIGAQLADMDAQIEQVKERAPRIVFLAIGMNDVVSASEDADQFRTAYMEFVRKVREAVPNARIFVNSIFPVQESAIQEEPALADIEEYNAVLKEICGDMQIGFIDNTEIVSDGYYEDDGIHFNSSFYEVWANHMAEVAAL